MDYKNARLIIKRGIVPGEIDSMQLAFARGYMDAWLEFNIAETETEKRSNRWYRHWGGLIPFTDPKKHMCFHCYKWATFSGAFCNLCVYGTVESLSRALKWIAPIWKRNFAKIIVEDIFAGLDMIDFDSAKIRRKRTIAIEWVQGWFDDLEENIAEIFFEE